MPFGMFVDCCNEDVFYCTPNVAFDILDFLFCNYLKDEDRESQAAVLLLTFSFS